MLAAVLLQLDDGHASKQKYQRDPLDMGQTLPQHEHGE